MEKQNEQIVFLRNFIEESVCREIKTPMDFVFLREIIQERTGELLSIATLKRIWGYVNGYKTIRFSTLSILSRAVGFKNWTDFLENYYSNSNIITVRSLYAESLETGDRLTVYWNIKNCCTLEYCGRNIFSVVESSVPELECNALFHCSYFIEGQPLYLDKVRKNRLSFILVIGTKGGLTKIEKHPSH